MVYIQPDLLVSKLEKIFSNTSQNFKNVVIDMQMLNFKMNMVELMLVAM